METKTLLIPYSIFFSFTDVEIMICRKKGIFNGRYKMGLDLEEDEGLST